MMMAPKPPSAPMNKNGRRRCQQHHRQRRRRSLSAPSSPTVSFSDAAAAEAAAAVQHRHGNHKTMDNTATLRRQRANHHHSSPPTDRQKQRQQRGRPRERRGRGGRDRDRRRGPTKVAYYESPRLEVSDEEIFPQQPHKLKHPEARQQYISKIAGDHRQDPKLLHVNLNLVTTPRALQLGMPKSAAEYVEELHLPVLQQQQQYEKNIHHGMMMGYEQQQPSSSVAELPAWLDAVVATFPNVRHLYLQKEEAEKEEEKEDGREGMVAESDAMDADKDGSGGGRYAMVEATDEQSSDDDDDVGAVVAAAEKHMKEECKKEEIVVRRLYVLYRLPQLETLDGKMITRQERSLACLGKNRPRDRRRQQQQKQHRNNSSNSSSTLTTSSPNTTTAAGEQAQAKRNAARHKQPQQSQGTVQKHAAAKASVVAAAAAAAAAAPTSCLLDNEEEDEDDNKHNNNNTSTLKSPPPPSQRSATETPVEVDLNGSPMSLSSSSPEKGKKHATATALAPTAAPTASSPPVIRSPPRPYDDDEQRWEYVSVESSTAACEWAAACGGLTLPYFRNNNRGGRNHGGNSSSNNDLDVERTKSRFHLKLRKSTPERRQPTHQASDNKGVRATTDPAATGAATTRTHRRHSSYDLAKPIKLQPAVAAVVPGQMDDSPDSSSANSTDSSAYFSAKEETQRVSASESLTSPFPMQFRNRGATPLKYATLAAPAKDNRVERPNKLKVTTDFALSESSSGSGPSPPPPPREATRELNTMETIETPIPLTRTTSSPPQLSSARKGDAATLANHNNERRPPTNDSRPPPCPGIRRKALGSTVPGAPRNLSSRPGKSMATKQTKKRRGAGWREKASARSTSIIDDEEDDDDDEEEESETSSNEENIEVFDMEGLSLVEQK